jgi:hypothetical protein
MLGLSRGIFMKKPIPQNTGTYQVNSQRAFGTAPQGGYNQAILSGG